MQKKSPLKVLQNGFRPLRFPVNKCVPNLVPRGRDPFGQRQGSGQVQVDKATRTLGTRLVRPSKLDACANVTTCCCRELGVLPKFQSKTFLKIHEYPRADDFEGKKRLHGV